TGDEGALERSVGPNMFESLDDGLVSKPVMELRVPGPFRPGPARGRQRQLKNISSSTAPMIADLCPLSNPPNGGGVSDISPTPSHATNPAGRNARAAPRRWHDALRQVRARHSSLLLGPFHWR